MLINQSLLLVEIILFAIAFGLFVPTFLFFLECIAALFPRNQTLSYYARATPSRVDVLVPAHNEAAGITATLQSLLPQLVERDRLIVIADNCDDDTAALARKAGATVIERREPERRGKGYALNYGLQFLAADPPEVVVIVDADCIVHPGTIARISRLTLVTQGPVQTVYLLKQPFKPRLKELISVLAFTVKNLVRPRGLNLLGLPCLLTGTGMAFPWSVIREIPWNNNSIVEDMQLSVDLAIAGYFPTFCLETKVTGVLPQQRNAVKSQRKRWEHGHLQTLLTQVPKLLKASLRQKSFVLLAFALDLCIPPLSLLVMLWGVVMMGALLAVGLGVSWTPATLLAIEGFLIGLSIFAAWFKFSRADVPMQALLAVPLYVISKIPLYFAFLVRRQTKWIRTSRDVVDPVKS